MDSARLPRIAPSALQRRRFEAFLAAHQDVPLKVVAAPCGAGKTTAAVLYARCASHPVRYLRVPHGGGVSGFWEESGRSFGRPIRSVADLIEALGPECRELIVDEVEAANGELRDVLARLPLELPEHLSAIYLTRSRTTIDAVRGATAWTTVLAPASLLAFDADEVGALGALLRVNASEKEAAQLVTATDGWAFAVAGGVREAAAGSVGLGRAYRAWQERHQLLLAEVAARTLLDVPLEYRRAAERLYAGESVAGATAAALAGSGLLVTTTGDRLRPIRPILTAGRGEPAAETPVPKASIEVFGDFEMTIGGKRVAWLRRRDRQIVAFLALRPDGRATRDELISTFWPEANAQLAAQSLRTACSTIRRALAQCVGYDRVERYFTAGRDVRLDFDNVETTAQRLDEHLQRADDALARDVVDEARANYVAALRIYRGALLENEGGPAWSAALAAGYRTAIEACERYRLELRRNRGTGARRDDRSETSFVVA